MDKHQRYRRKCIAEGRCPHCGKQCAPYLECDDRRLKKRLLRHLSNAVKAGAVEKLPDGRFRFKADTWHVGKASGGRGDRRMLPKIADKPTRADSIIRKLALLIADQHGGVVTEKQIAKSFGQMRLRHSRRAR